MHRSAKAHGTPLVAVPRSPLTKSSSLVEVDEDHEQSSSRSHGSVLPTSRTITCFVQSTREGRSPPPRSESTAPASLDLERKMYAYTL